MRFSARARHVVWSERARAAGVRECILGLIDAGDVPVVRYRLAPNEGIVCNNVLHNRAAFEDAGSSEDGGVSRGQGRRLLRVRYHDRININNKH